MGPFARRAMFVVSAISIFGLTACERMDESGATPVEPVQRSAKPAGCDFGRMAQDARDYFPGTGKGSISDQVQDLIKLMQADCAEGDRAGYTAHWFDVAELLEGVLEAGQGGAPATGASFLATSVSVVGPLGQTPIFAPCGADPVGGCVPWDGYPVLPDFEGVLSSADGAWAVPTLTGSEAVCSSFVHPCDYAELAGTAPDGEAWGVNPESTWGDAFYDRETLLFGQPLGSGSPTNETLANSLLASYEWLIIPHVDEFGSAGDGGAVTGSALEVGLCSNAPAQVAELLVQKNRTILTETALAWCTLQVLGSARTGGSTWDRFVDWLSPSPLVASAGIQGPGGSAGSFTEFYAVDVPTTAVLALSDTMPAGAPVGQPIQGRDGQPLAALTFTSSQQSPLEDALVTITVIGNSGLIPSGNDVSGADLSCTNYVCTGYTQADEDPTPGSLLLPLVFTKPGQYSLCLTAELAPLTFNTLCTAKFNVTP